MQTRSSLKLSRYQTSNPTSSTNPTPKGRIRRSSKQKVENSNFEEHLTTAATMTDNRTMAEMLRAPTEGCAVVPSILAEQFELKHSLINMMTLEQFFGLEKDNPHDHIWAACQWLEKEPPHSITTWDDLQTSVVTTAMTDLLKQLQANPPLAQVKAVEEICVTCGAQFNQNFHLNELEKIKRMNDVSLKSMQNQIDMVKNELRNEMKTSIQTSLSNQTNEIKNMIASLLQMNTASTSGSGSLRRNTVANPKGELKAITTRSGLVTDGPTETYTDPDIAEYTIKVPPPPVKKPKPPIQRHFVLHTRDSPPLNIS
nr:reverse transcriptase domain-containing protein [Tanacetum cinerariifolium]